jgi:hypothetical protein
MPITQKPTFENVPLKEDGEPLTLEDWVATLSAEEQAAFATADAERAAAVQAQIDLGNLFIGKESGNLVWDDGADTGSIVTEAWEPWFNRYTSENNITFIDVIE